MARGAAPVVRGRRVQCRRLGKGQHRPRVLRQIGRENDRRPDMLAKMVGKTQRDGCCRDAAGGRTGRGAGLSITGQRNVALLKPGQIGNIGALRSYHRVHGDRGLRRALDILARAYPGCELPAHAALFVAIGGVLATEGADAAPLLAALIVDRTQDEWRTAFADHARSHGGTPFGAALPALLAAYREAAEG